MSKDSDMLALIFSELKEQRAELSLVRKDVAKLAVDVGGLKIKTGIWGALAGLISSALLFLGVMFKGVSP